MDWIELYGADKQSTKTDIDEYIASPLWDAAGELQRAAEL